MSNISADGMQDAEGRQYHIGLAPGEVAPMVMMVGDPHRATRVSKRFDSVRVERSCREYTSYTGTHEGLELTVLGTGIGSDNTEIAVQELLHCVEKPTLLRVGSSGGLREEAKIGHVVVSTGAVRLESTSLGFVQEGYPAVAHHEVVLAAITAAERAGHPYHVGLTATAAGFYGWQGRTDQPIKSRHAGLPAELGERNVLNMEMEASTLLTMGTLAGIRAGCVCAVFGNRFENRFAEHDEKYAAEARAIDIGLGALHVLAEMDAAAGGGRFHLPARS
ncbi:MAG: uridine phosphorylase [Planctomycetota bacterium]|nr:MAG: uridine phosphorylase [Planctomycetota bacterium]